LLAIAVVIGRQVRIVARLEGSRHPHPRGFRSARMPKAQHQSCTVALSPEPWAQPCSRRPKTAGDARVAEAPAAAWPKSTNKSKASALPDRRAKNAGPCQAHALEWT
jgi:hypothetical protein